MAYRLVTQQKKATRRPEEAQEELDSAPTEYAENVADLLDEIDTVLEANAEEFVNAFVQKGGQ